MKIRVVLIVEVSSSKWADEFEIGNNEEEVREDVRTYVQGLVSGAEVLTSLGAQVTRG